jgi:hypothetical protein
MNGVSFANQGVELFQEPLGNLVPGGFTGDRDSIPLDSDAHAEPVLDIFDILAKFTDKRLKGSDIVKAYTTSQSVTLR